MQFFTSKKLIILKILYVKFYLHIVFTNNLSTIYKNAINTIAIYVKVCYNHNYLKQTAEIQKHLYYYYQILLN